MRQKLRKLIADPMAMLSRRLNALPQRTDANSETTLPKRRYDRRLKDDPRLKKSKTDTWLPNVTLLKTEVAEPSRAKLRKEMADPTIAKSNTEILDPSLEHP
jgi:hypothetical protein